MTPQTTAILEKILEVCPELMELSFGCEVIVRHDAIEKHFIIEKLNESVWEIGTPNHYVMSGLNEGGRDITIIGHEPHLEHLLRVLVTKNGVYDSYFIHANGWIMNEHTKDHKTTVTHHALYDTTLSLTQNLETNTELREWVYKLICE